MLYNTQPLNNEELRQHIWAEVDSIDNIVNNVICIEIPPLINEKYKYIHVVSGMGFVYPGDKWDSTSNSFIKLATDHKIVTGEIEPDHVSSARNSVEEKESKQDKSNEQLEKSE